VLVSEFTAHASVTVGAVTTERIYTLYPRKAGWEPWCLAEVSRSE
jgi:hypothetical protein